MDSSQEDQQQHNFCTTLTVAQKLLLTGTLWMPFTSILLKIENIVSSSKDMIKNWSITWLLNFRPDKYHILIIENYKTSNMPIIIVLVIKNQNMPLAKKPLVTLIYRFEKRFAKPIQLLGLFIEASITFTDYRLSPKLFRQLFVTFVRPILEYAQVIVCFLVLRKSMNRKRSKKSNQIDRWLQESNLHRKSCLAKPTILGIPEGCQ